MSLSAKEKAQLQSKRIKKLKYKATGLFLYHPATDSWIPAQCDDEGRLVIDPADLDTRYHKKGEDLNLEDFDIDLGESAYYRYLKGPGSLIKFHPTSAYIYLRNRADTGYASFAAGACTYTSIIGLTSACIMKPRAIDNSWIEFQARDNDTDLMHKVAQVLSGSLPEFNIDHAGDIEMNFAKAVTHGIDGYFRVGQVKRSDGLPGPSAALAQRLIVLIDDEAGGNPDEYKICLSDGATPIPNFAWHDIHIG